PAVRMTISSLAVSDAAFWMRAKSRDLLVELLRQQQVIAVEVLNKLAAGRLASCFSRKPRPGVRLMNNANLLRMRFTKLIRDSWSVVRRAIIDDDQLDGAIGLRQHARDGFTQQHRAVVDRDDRGDQTVNHHGLSQARFFQQHGCWHRELGFRNDRLLRGCEKVFPQTNDSKK